MAYEIIPERPGDGALIEALHDRAFGIDRQSKTVYRLREQIEPIPELSFIARAADDGLLASLRFWPIEIDGASACLLGPLSVEPALRGRGIGKALVRHGLEEAPGLGLDLCVVVGDREYYEPFGFQNAGAAGLLLPGPVDTERFQVKELTPGALEGAQGMIHRAGTREEAAGDPSTSRSLTASEGRGDRGLTILGKGVSTP